MLRDCLRAVGVVPILMSTHSGSHTAGSTDSRIAADGPPLWCRIITKLPRFYSQHPPSDAFQLLPTERPLVQKMVEGKSDLASSVAHVRTYFQRSNRPAWTADPVFQLCQLFCSRQEKAKNSSALADRLVGVHFGHYFEATANDLLWHRFFDRHRMLAKAQLSSPEEEPILFLALTTWKAVELAEKKTLFPLVDSTGSPVSVRTVFNGSQCFATAIDTQNPTAMKLNGNQHVEVLVLAALTLASLRCDDGFLAKTRCFALSQRFRCF